MTRITDGRDAGAFITAALDDFGLDSYAFRIYARIVRRAGTKHGCFESIDNMANACHMKRDTVYKALKLLIKHRLIEKEPHAGKPSNYYLTPSSEWIPLSDLSQKGDTEPIPKRGHHLSPIGDTTYPEKGTPPIPNKGHKGINKGNPIKGSTSREENSVVVDAGNDPFFTGQHRAIAREIVKVSREFNAPKNFITDSPWGKLADEVGKDPLGVWKAFEQFLLAKHSDKRDPANYCSVIANKLYENVGSELNCKEWNEFSDHFKKHLSAPPPPKKSEPRQPEITQIPDRESSARAIREARRG